MDPIAQLIYKIEELERRLSNVVRAGRVTHVAHDGENKGKVRFSDGDDNDETAFKSGWMTWQELTGDKSTRSMPKVGQQVVMISPGGLPELGWVQQGGYLDSDDMPAAPNGEAVYRKKDGDKAVTVTDTQGKRTEVADEEHTTTVGQFKHTITKDGGHVLSAGGLSLTINTEEFHFRGGKIMHEGKTIDATHKHTGIMPGGALTGEPA